MNTHRWMAGIVVVSLLSACGSRFNGDETTEDSTKVPDSALTSSSAFTLYAGSLVNSETGAPVTFGDNLSPPKSETEEPLALR